MALSASDLAGMRSTAQSFMPDTCDIQRPTRTPSAGGGTTVTWTVIATVPCWLEMPGPGTEDVTGGVIGATEELEIKVPAGTDVNEKDRLNVTTSTVGQSGLYEVTSIDVRSYEVERVLHAKRIT